LLVRAEAAADIEAIQQRYRGIRPDLALDFEGSLRDLIDRLLVHPLAYRVVFADVRRAPMPKPYRYAVAYCVAGDAVVVIGCLHGAQDFNRIRSRR
jgi:plasmid stabilization system protein ParE